MWGIKGINKEGVDRFNASQLGTAEWDDTFEMSSVEAQKDVYEFCQQLKKQRDMLYQPGTVFCWIDDFKAYIEPQIGFPVDSNGDSEIQK